MPSLQSVPSLPPGRLSLRAATSGLMTAVVVALLPAPASADDQADAPTPTPVTSTDSTSTDSTSTDSTSTATDAAAPADATTVRLRVGSRGTRSLRTSADWAAGLLREQGVRVSRRDQVRVVRDDRRVAGDRRRLRGGDTVKVVRVDREVTSRRVRLRAGVEERRTTSLRPGQRRVVRDGRPGVRRVRVIRVTHNQRVVRRAVRKDVLREPRPRRVLVGAARRSVPGADHLDWRALARCESGGNPRAVNPAGYYGLYQFDVSTWRSVGGSGMPHRASAGEQTYRAKLLYGQRGRSPWPHCGRHL